MQLNPYLFYNGNCEEALQYYRKVLGAQLGMPIPADWKNKIMHASISIDGEVLMASDATPGDYHPPQGFAVSLHMPFGKTFFSNGFGMCVDKFGIPWMVNCPMDM